MYKYNPLEHFSISSCKICGEYLTLIVVFNIYLPPQEFNNSYIILIFNNTTCGNIQNLSIVMCHNETPLVSMKFHIFRLWMGVNIYLPVNTMKVTD